MAHWDDQEPYDGIVLAHFSGHKGMVWEVEKSNSKGTYRLTGGNLFGSQSVHIETADDVLRMMHFHAQIEKKPTLEEVLKRPGVIRVEDRRVEKEDKQE